MLVAQRSEPAESSTFPWRIVLAATVVAGLFLLWPGDLRHKAHLVLQGVCAQRPSHSLQFSGQPLPVDARMTGIYLGAGSSLLWYLLILRAKCSGRFTRVTWTLLAFGIGVMALDGLNSLAVDLRLPAPYTTTNLLRLTTGLVAGVAIGTLLSHLATLSLAHRPPGGWRPASATTLAPPLAAGAFICTVALSGLPTLVLPYTYLIVASVVAVLWAMTSVLASLALGRSWGFASSQQRDETLAIALVLACVVLAGLALWRAWLEGLIAPLNLS